MIVTPPSTRRPGSIEAFRRTSRKLAPPERRLTTKLLSLLSPRFGSVCWEIPLGPFWSEPLSDQLTPITRLSECSDTSSPARKKGGCMARRLGTILVDMGYLDEDALWKVSWKSRSGPTTS